MKLKKILLVLLALVVVAVLGILVFAEWRYQMVLTSPRVDARNYALPHTSILIRLDPEPAKEYLVSRHLAPRGIPSWVAGMTMPREAQIQLDPDLTAAKSDLRLFVNTRRLGPLLAGVVNKTALAAPPGDPSWDPDGMTSPRRGAVLLDGEMRLGPATVELIRTYWGVMTPMLPLELRGGHLAEAVLDMRDGRGYAVLAELLGRNTSPQEIQHPSNLVHFFVKMDHVRIFADTTSDTELALTIEIECLPTLDPSEVNSLRGLVDLLYNQLRPMLQSELGVMLDGGAVVDGQTVRGTYILSDFNVLVDRILPGA
jgi:hypothetical protein